MKILVDINHPAHVHFFKNFIWQVQKKGYKVLITTINKDIALDLLDAYGFKYITLGNYQKSLLAKAISIPLSDFKLLKIALKFNPDILLGIASYKISHIGWLLKKKSYIFDDTEHSKAEIMLYKPFASKIFTPACFYKDLGNKQIRYNGYHELAYLHPNYFKPNLNVLKEIGLVKNSIFTLIRFVSWEASHDFGNKGLSLKNKILLVKELKKFGRVFITSEKKLPPELEKYKITIDFTKIHQIMYYASLIFSESATMASEAAVMGTHAVFCDFIGRSYTDEEENRYGLVYNYKLNKESQTNSIQKAIELLKTPNLREFGQRKRKKLLSEKIDTTTFIIKKITEN